MSVSKPQFPSDFFWGYATASAQVEGSLEVDGRGPSIWDTFSAIPSHSEDGKSNVIATDFYNQYQHDVDLMKSYGVNAHRLSLSWSRILPEGRRGSPVNEAGVHFYRKVLKSLLEAGITPFVTLFHWDLPQTLQDAYDGFLNGEIVADFENYARICYDRFGDLVQHWFTINEPNVYSILGHCFGRHAPGRSSNREISEKGDSSTEPFIVGHNLLLAHATAVKVYREEFKSRQAGQIGLVVNMLWGEPFDDAPDNIKAAQTFIDCVIGWFTEPLNTGDYPQSLKALRGSALPQFTPTQSQLVAGSTDFIAVNHYTTMWVKACKRDYEAERSRPWEALVPGVETGFVGKDGKEIGAPAGLSWVRPVPWGFGKLMSYLHDRYPWDIYISENGVVCPNEHTLPREDAVQDDFRVAYLESYADQIALKIKEGVPVKSYLMWAWTDNFEWQEGYTARFGVVWVDYEDSCKRYPKRSVGHMRDYFAQRMSK